MPFIIGIMRFALLLIIGILNMSQVSAENVSIIFGGPVSVLWSDEDGNETKEITDLKVIKAFSGNVYSEQVNGKPESVKLSEYLQDSEQTSELYELGVRGGVLEYDFRDDLNQLWLVMEYSSPRQLNDTELDVLYKFTEGQWYDGAGEIFSAQLQDQNKGVAPLGHPSEVYLFQNP